MGLPALAETLEAFSPVPMPAMAFDQNGVRQVDDLKKNIVRILDNYRSDIARSRSAVQAQEDAVAASFAGLAAVADEAVMRATINTWFNPIVAGVEQVLAGDRRQIEDWEQEASDRLTRFTAIHPPTARFLRKQIRRATELMAQHHEFLAQAYYRLLALRADFDPDARGGPQFSDPAELREFLEAS